jgi:hypothetical protein
VGINDGSLSPGVTGGGAVPAANKASSGYRFWIDNPMCDARGSIDLASKLTSSITGLGFHHGSLNKTTLEQ